MVTYKNIRIPKRGGGTRLQRVQVLASGKYKFVKNKKTAKRKTTKRVRSKSRSIRRSSKIKNRGKRMARKFTLPVALIGGVVGMQATQRAVNALSRGSIEGVMKALPNYVGVDDGKFYPNLLIKNVTPLAIGVGLHIAARKLGVNRMLGQAGVPVLRI